MFLCWLWVYFPTISNAFSIFSHNRIDYFTSEWCSKDQWRNFLLHLISSHFIASIFVNIICSHCFWSTYEDDVDFLFFKKIYMLKNHNTHMSIIFLTYAIHFNLFIKIWSFSSFIHSFVCLWVYRLNSHLLFSQFPSKIENICKHF